MILILMYGSKIMVWKERKGSGITAIQKDNLEPMIGVRETDKIKK